MSYREVFYNEKTGGLVPISEKAEEPADVLRYSDIHVKKEKPAVVLEGTESGAIKVSLKEDGGKIVLRDETNAVDEMVVDRANDRVDFKRDVRHSDTGASLLSHGSRHDIGGPDEIPGLASHGSRHGYGGADSIPDNGLRFSQIDKVFGDTSTVTVNAGATSTIPKGIYYVFCGANTTVEVYDATNATWRTLISAGGAGLVISDGSNVRLNNTGTAAEDSYLIPIL